jgi:hypothetical protein
MTAVCACVPQELYSMRSGAIVGSRDEEDGSRAAAAAAHAAHVAAAGQAAADAAALAAARRAAEEADDERDPILAAAAAAFFGAISAVDGCAAGPQQQQQQQQQAPPPPPPQPLPLPPNPFASAAAHMTYLPMQHMPSSAVPMMFSAAVPMQQPMQPMVMAAMAPPPPPPPMAPAPSFGPACLQLNPAFLERMRSSMLYGNSTAPGGLPAAPAMPLRLHQSVTTAGPSAAAVAPAMPAPHAFSAPQPSYRPHPLFAATSNNEANIANTSFQQQHHQQGSPMKRGREEPLPRRSGGSGNSNAVPPSAAPQQQQPQQPTPKPLPQQLLRHTRRISCRTYLKRLNVTQFMSDHLLPLAPGSARAPGATRLPRSYELLFKEVVTLVLDRGTDGGEDAHGADDAEDPRAPQRRRTSEDHSAGGGGPSSPSARPRRQTRDLASGSSASPSRLSCFPVTYEGVLCASQRHLRLTCGWSEFARASGLRVGDAVTFERRGEDRSVLHVSIARGDIVAAPGAVALAGAAPPASRRGRGGGARRSGSGSGGGSGSGSDGGDGGSIDGGAAAAAAVAAAAPGAPVAGTAPVLMQRWGSGTFLI